MSAQKKIDFNRIAEAIAYMKAHFTTQPNLDEVAQAVHLSPYHFQRLFNEWVGISPKKFMQYLTVSYAKSLIKEHQLNLFDTIHATGLSSSSRLHELFINIEGMSPASFKNGGKQLIIHYSYEHSPFGEMLVASTPIGICHMAFIHHKHDALIELKNQFPNASYILKSDLFHQEAMAIFKDDWKNIQTIKLHLKGTPFQLKVWQSLLKIPQGKLSTYGQLAAQIENKNAARAVGSAIGSNPVAFLIPCHRVIQTSGIIGGYKWGTHIKSAIIGWEGVKSERLI
mgnify:CR=1 FL=1